MIDKISIDGSVAVTTGALTLVSRVYGNPAALAAFSAITGTPATVTIALGPSNKSMLITTVITPDSPVGIVAEGKRFVENHTHDTAGTLL